MGYLHCKIDCLQDSKYPGQPCGDAWDYLRDDKGTLVIIADGLGSGVKANIAALLCISRLKELVRGGTHLRKAFRKVAETMNSAVENNLPYAVFMIMRILNDGSFSIFNYDMPSPILLYSNQSKILKGRTRTIGEKVTSEFNGWLDSGMGLLCVSDGITQAGLGMGYPLGWGEEGLNDFIFTSLLGSSSKRSLVKMIRKKSLEICGGTNQDDYTILAVRTTEANITNIFTGPPARQSNDKFTVQKFLAGPGRKVICGATTARIVSEYTGNEIQNTGIATDDLTPPESRINGIDLVCEGVMTLNQLFNLLDEDREVFDEDNPVTKLYDIIHSSDRINFILGRGINPADSNIRFRQMGLIKRDRVVRLIACRLREKGKYVSIEEV